MNPSKTLDRRRSLLILVALAAGAAVPIQLVTLSFGYAQYVEGVPKGPRLIPLAHEFAANYLVFVYLPAMLVLAAIVLHARNRYPELFRRIVVGFSMGAVATLALDAIRQMGVIHGWLPGDTPVLFGRMVTGSDAFLVLWAAGLAVHYLNGAGFGLFYAFVWGWRGSYGSAVIWATVWALVLELGMMLGPPMGPMVGLFGVDHSWPGLFLITLVAHLFFGVTLGLLVEKFLTPADHGGLMAFLRGRRRAHAPPESTS